MHPSYPYGNPTNLKHPAARPRKPTDISSRALFSDLSYAGGGVNGALRWRDLALDRLLPVDHDKEEAARAALARKLASGASHNNNPTTQPQTQPAQQPENEENEGNEEDEGETDDAAEESTEEEADNDDNDDIENSENIELSIDES